MEGFHLIRGWTNERLKDEPMDQPLMLLSADAQSDGVVARLHCECSEDPSTSAYTAIGASLVYLKPRDWAPCRRWSRLQRAHAGLAFVQ